MIQTVWAIERFFGGQPEWLSMRRDYSIYSKEDEEFQYRLWSPTFDDAIQFTREEDASKFALAVVNSRGVGYQITEHAIG